jgi:hypothetical protein
LSSFFSSLQWAGPGSVCLKKGEKVPGAVDLIFDVLPFGLWYGEPDATSNAIGYTRFRSRSHPAVIRVYDEAGNVIQTREHAGDFKEP